MTRTWTAFAASGSVPWRTVAVLVVATGAFIGGWVSNGWRKESQMERLIAEHAANTSAQAQAAATAIAQARVEEHRRIAAQTEIANAATEDARKARMAARDAGAAADRLRGRVAELVAASRAGEGSNTAGAGEAADDPRGMLADVLGRADRRAGILAEYADAARIAGHACERAYDALSPR